MIQAPGTSASTTSAVQLFHHKRLIIIITEANAVSAEGRITYGDLGIYKDEHIRKLREITDFIHANGAIAGTQLSHAGRKSSHICFFYLLQPYCRLHETNVRIRINLQRRHMTQSESDICHRFYSNSQFCLLLNLKNKRCDAN
jgi:2,4-dienoyl-CoA reductase-like NADH-dependent reductase (Old Yellow Enzyme family)